MSGAPMSLLLYEVWSSRAAQQELCKYIILRVTITTRAYKSHNREYKEKYDSMSRTHDG